VAELFFERALDFAFRALDFSFCALDFSFCDDKDEERPESLNKRVFNLYNPLKLNNILFYEAYYSMKHSASFSYNFNILSRCSVV